MHIMHAILHSQLAQLDAPGASKFFGRSSLPIRRGCVGPATQAKAHSTAELHCVLAFSEMLSLIISVSLAAFPALTTDPPEAPVLNIDSSGISCSGISSGADFAVQFATAFSKHIVGVGVFAGQPYHCAVTRFPLDKTFPCNETTPAGHGPVGPAGCQTNPFVLPTEPASPLGEGLL